MSFNILYKYLFAKNNLFYKSAVKECIRCAAVLSTNCKTIKPKYSNYICINSFHSTAYLSKRRKTGEEKKAPRIIEYPPKSKREHKDVWMNMTVKELQDVLGVNRDEVHLLLKGEQIGPVITDLKLLQEAVRRCGYKPRMVAPPTTIEEKIIEKDAVPRPPADKSLLRPRPPVVTIMGHVDHGKTTLLDALRHSSIVDKEFGGITQHIGAFTVTLKNGSIVTFLDTPGHAAFTAMRARGANVTDIVVLVVAADDGVMEQTLESIKMAKNANVPILVAINKIDAPGADVKRTERMLAEYGVMVESMGGDVQSIPISALKNTNLNQLTEALVLQAELLELSADPTGLVEGTVIESRKDRGKGKMCTAIIQRGTLTKGAVLIAGSAMAKVRAMKDADGQPITEAKPSQPVEIEGWRELPGSGDLILQVETESRARDVIRIREKLEQEEKAQEEAPVIAAKMEKHQLEYQTQLKQKRSLGYIKTRRTDKKTTIFDKSDDSTPTLSILIKADVDGTLEAILNCFSTYNKSNECKLDLVSFDVGEITENDIELAKTFNGIIYTFNTGYSNRIKNIADENEVEIKSFNVIYKLIDDVKEEINSRLPQKAVEENLGEASILQVFTITDAKKKVPVAGSRCVKGILKRNAQFRLLRSNKVVFEGKLKSMRHLKNEVDVIKTNMECGLQLGVENPVNVEVGDNIVCYEIKMENQVTSWNPGF